ncbi:hypothetical protein [Caenimonas aquaedulcis]|uniref:Uncharacterized protein n=1 Tax=Caenimonas aquaedulcis TaxID=2793270 RepID=A0A931H5Y7_9BURK|nr:hypothetical protein [Caenimonas aquaedulcis]MBG9389048.1 hypothetical protein [Caenimonas aquaedulcis]
MFTRHLPLLGAVLIAGAAVAQASGPAAVANARIVGKTAKVQGLVTVSLGTSVSSVVNDAPVYEGSRFVTGSTGSAELDFGSGCIVALVPNQTLTVDSAATCDDRKAAVLWLTGGTVAAAGGASYVPLAGLAYVAGIALIDSTIRTGPTGGGGKPGGPNDGGTGGIPDPDISGQ